MNLKSMTQISANTAIHKNKIRRFFISITRNALKDEMEALYTWLPCIWTPVIGGELALYKTRWGCVPLCDDPKTTTYCAPSQGYAVCFRFMVAQ